MEKNYNKSCACGYCQGYRQIQPMTIPQSWVSGIKNQQTSVNQLYHIEPEENDPSKEVK